jgi:hypothetical protein
MSSSGTVTAKGLVIAAGGGGSDGYGGRLDPCSMSFTDIWDPWLGFPGYLATS